MERAKVTFDIILVEYGDMKGYDNSIAFDSYVDGVVFLLSEGQTRISVIVRSLSRLKGGQCNLLGTIFNQRTFPIPRIIYDWV